MKKTIIYGALSVFAAVYMTGCSDTMPSESEENIQVEADNEVSGDSTEEVSEEGTDSEKETGSEEELVLELLGQYLDLTPYEENNGLVIDNQLSDVVEAMTVNGQEFKIGMKWEDILSTGYEPTDPEFADEKTGALAYTCDFINSDNALVNLGFIGEEGQTVSAGSLYSIHVSLIENESSEFEVAGIRESSTVEEIIATLGNPYSIKDPAFKDYTDCGLTYRCEDRDIELTFYTDLETGKILTAALEGYGA